MSDIDLDKVKNREDLENKVLVLLQKLNEVRSILNESKLYEEELMERLKSLLSENGI